jgi:hypothetical protein
LLDHRCLRNDAVGPETRRLVNLFKTFAKNVCGGVANPVRGLANGT